MKDDGSLGNAIARLNRQNAWQIVGALVIGLLLGVLLALGYNFEATGGWR